MPPANGTKTLPRVKQFGQLKRFQKWQQADEKIISLPARASVSSRLWPQILKDCSGYKDSEDNETGVLTCSACAHLPRPPPAKFCPLASAPHWAPHIGLFIDILIALISKGWRNQGGKWWQRIHSLIFSFLFSTYQPCDQIISTIQPYRRQNRSPQNNTIIPVPSWQMQIPSPLPNSWNSLQAEEERKTVVHQAFKVPDGISSPLVGT